MKSDFFARMDAINWRMDAIFWEQKFLLDAI
jgi:hypothetical protein